MKIVTLTFKVERCDECPYYGCGNDKIRYCSKYLMPAVIQTENIPDWCPLEDVK